MHSSCRNRMVIEWLFVLVILMSSCPALAGDKAVSHSQYDARVLSEETRLNVGRNGEALCTVTRKVRILNETGMQYAQAHFRESPFIKTTAATGSNYDDSGRCLLTRTKKDFRKVCGFDSYALYADDCDYWLELGAGNYPFTVEYSYSQKISSLFFWPYWSPQSDIPVDTSRFVATVPEGFSFRTKVTGDVGDAVVAETENGKSYVWTLTDVAAFESEPSMPPKELYQAGLQFAPGEFRFEKFEVDGSDWGTLARSMWEITKGSFTVGKAQLQALDSIFPTHRLDLNGCQRLHSFLSKRSRYVAITIGIGGWQPHTSESTFSHGYGDCKDLATMYASMLRQVGGNARLALVKTRTEGRTDPDFPSLNFNHAIMFLVDGVDTTWIDPTCFACEVGDLPWWDENIAVLVIDSINGSIVHTPASSAEENVITRKATLTLSDDLTLTVSIEITAVGNPGSRLHTLVRTLPTTDVKDELAGFPPILSKRMQIDSLELGSSEQGLSRSQFRVVGEIRNYARRIDSKLYLDLSALPMLGDFERINFDQRIFPAELQYPYTFVDTIVLSLPPAYKFVEIPRDTLDIDLDGNYRFSHTLGTERVVIVRSRSFTRYRIDPDHFEHFIEYRSRLVSLERRSLVLERR